jgi:hypothetical protein
MAQLPLFQTDQQKPSLENTNQTLSMLQTKWKAILDPIIKASGLGGASVAKSNLSITGGTVQVTTATTSMGPLFVVSLKGLSAAANATLPSAVGIGGFQYLIINQDTTYTVTALTNGGQTIGGRASGSIVLAAGLNDYLHVISDNANWQILAKKETSLLSNYASGSVAINTSLYPSVGCASVTLSPGTWRLYGNFGFNQGNASSSDSVNLGAGTGIYATAGTGSGSAPTALSTIGTILGSAILGGAFSTATAGSSVTGANVMCVLPPLLLTLTASHAVYAVAACSNTTQSGSTACTVQTYLFAERVW